MSLIYNIISILREAALGVTFEAGKYPENAYDIKGKVIFAGGMGVSEYDKPRNVMGGDVVRIEMFKVVLKGDKYCDLELAQIKIKDLLKREGYIQLSGLEHIEPQEDGLPQIAVTFKSTKQN